MTISRTSMVINRIASIIAEKEMQLELLKNKLLSEKSEEVKNTLKEDIKIIEIRIKSYYTLFLFYNKGKRT